MRDDGREKAMTVGVGHGSEVTVRVPGGDVDPFVEKTGTMQQVGLRWKKGPLLLEEASEEHCVGFQLQNPRR